MNKPAVTLTPSQKKVFEQLCAFVQSDRQRVFILKGYAGTGKTTLTRFLIKELQDMELPYCLLASTGRAAKILTNLSGTAISAQTIHSLIYKLKDFNQDLSDIKENEEPDGQLFLVFDVVPIDPDSTPETVYIVDEASMVANVPEQNVLQAVFGSGMLLKELLDYDQRPNSKFIFIGDPCQLPPITENQSPALSESYFKHFFAIEPACAYLTQIIRQNNDNSIITASQQLRALWRDAPDDDSVYGNLHYWSNLPFGQNKDIQIHPNSDAMINDYIRKIQQGDFSKATCICQSNSDCHKLSERIRNEMGFDPACVQKGDLLLVIQNNHLTELMNGDMVIVDEVHPYVQQVAGLSFRRITLTELYSNRKYSLLLLENILNTNQLNLNQEQQKALFVDFARRMKRRDIRPKSQSFKEMMLLDPYLNALRCTYGYAITCHKAQGGEWDEVYLNYKRNIGLNPTKVTYQWLYTAVTRAKKKLHVVQDFFIRKK